MRLSTPPGTRRGVALVAVIVLLLVVALIIVGMVLGGARDQDLSIRRLETVRAFHAAEAGLNMAMREMMEGVDEDLDGGIGTISDNGDDLDDPAFGTAQVVVTSSVSGSQTTLRSDGRCGRAHRMIEAIVE